MWEGAVVSIHIAKDAAVPLESVEAIRAVPGRGLEGDRYFAKKGTYSAKPGSGREVTLIEVEALEALARDAGIELSATGSRRNIATRGVPLNHLVGKRFYVGEVLLEGTRLCEPCTHLEALTRQGLLQALLHRGGLRATIVTGGTIRVRDRIPSA